MAKQKKEIEYEFRVCYEPNPDYTGNWFADMSPGVHGKFKTLKQAQAQAEKAKKFFNEENVLQKLPDEKGKVKHSIKTTVHDNVIVWIEERRDGVLVEEEDQAEKVEKTQKKKEKAA